MAKIRSLHNQYDLHGQKLLGQSHDLLIVTRSKQKQSGGKTEKYILGIPHGEKKREYISSLYDTTQVGVYRMDYNGQGYALHLDAEIAYIKSTS